MVIITMSSFFVQLNHHNLKERICNGFWYNVIECKVMVVNTTAIFFIQVNPALGKSTFEMDRIMLQSVNFNLVVMTVVSWVSESCTGKEYNGSWKISDNVSEH